MTPHDNVVIALGEGPTPSSDKPSPGSEAIEPHYEESWSLVHRVTVLWRIATNIRTQREVARISKLPPFVETAKRDPRFAFKYLSDDYLVHGFSLGERASCFQHHYRRLSDSLSHHILRETLHSDITIHEIRNGVNRFSITMGLSRPYTKEGELSLSLQVDGEIVYILSFTIIPGWVVHSKSEEVLLISRLQGTPGCYPQIRLATKSLHDIAPPALLLAAIQGFAMAVGISGLAAVSASTHRYTCKEFAPVLKEAYDDFFTEIGICKNYKGFFLSSLPLREKPLEHIKHGHKLRTKQKRAFKKKVLSSCAEFLRCETSKVL